MQLFTPEMSSKPKHKTNNWYTPSLYIEAARSVMGSIDLDPASCEAANQMVKASRYFTKEDNGLLQEWGGNVFLNPPYGRVNPELKGSTRSWQVYFMKTLLEKYRRHETTQAIALVFGTSFAIPWFQPFCDFPLCVVKKRINFRLPDGTEAHYGYGNIFMYMGPHEAKFVEVFSQFGRIVRAIDTPKQSVQPATLWTQS